MPLNLSSPPEVLFIPATAENILQYVLTYAGRGWAVFPVHSVKTDGTCTCGKPDCASPGKHPATPNGVKDATTDQTALRECWRLLPWANVGVATGTLSGFWALDLDEKQGVYGMGVLMRAEERNCHLPSTIQVETGSGGVHLYFSLPDHPVKNGTHVLGRGSGVDVRGDGGYVVAPPSMHANGRKYTFSEWSRPFDFPTLPQMPAWFWEEITAARAAEKAERENSYRPEPMPRSSLDFGRERRGYGDTALASECSTIAAAAPGGQNDQLNRSAFNLGQLVAGGVLVRAQAERGLAEAAMKMVNDPTKGPWRIEQIERVIRSGLDAGMAYPRQVPPIYCEHPFKQDVAGVATSGDPSEQMVTIATVAGVAGEPAVEPELEFPIEALGDDVRKAILAIHNIVQAPVALCANSCLAAISLAAQGQADVVIPGLERRRPIGLYFLTIAFSGERKTSADSYALEAIRELEKALRVQWQSERTKYDVQLDVWQAEKNTIIKGTGSKKKDAATEREADLQALGIEPTLPLEPNLLFSEFTTEGLLKTLVSNTPSIGLFTDEGGELFGGWSMHDDRRLGTASTLAKFWDGSKVDRVRASGDRHHVIIEGRRVSAHFMAQPTIALAWLNDPIVQGQGLAARFLISFPKTTMGTRLFRDPTPENFWEVRLFGDRVRGLLARPLPVQQDRPDQLAPRSIALSAPAKSQWVGAFDEWEKGLAPGGDFERIRAFVSKCGEHACRLAAVLQLFDDPDAAEIDADHMASAIALGRYYLAQTLRLAGDADRAARVNDAEAAYQFIAKNWGDDMISPSDFGRWGPRSLRKNGVPRAVLQELCRQGRMEKLDSPALVGGKNVPPVKRTEVYRLLPS